MTRFFVKDAEYGGGYKHYEFYRPATVEDATAEQRAALEVAIAKHGRDSWDVLIPAVLAALFSPVEEERP